MNLGGMSVAHIGVAAALSAANEKLWVEGDEMTNAALLGAASTAVTSIAGNSLGLGNGGQTILAGASYTMLKGMIMGEDGTGHLNNAVTGALLHIGTNVVCRQLFPEEGVSNSGLVGRIQSSGFF
jgi:hypothetical protein